MDYRVDFAPAARHAFRKLPRDVQRRLDPHILALARTPRPPGAVPLAGGEGLLRIRVGDYRVIYSVHDDVLLVLVVRIGHRREVYRRL